MAITLDLLPDSIQGNLRIVVYVLLMLHLSMFTVWICLMIPTLNKKKTQEKYISEFSKKAQ